MPQDIKEHLILENRCKDITFYNTMQYKVLEMCIFRHIFLHFANGNSKIGVKFAYMRKNIYLCRLFMRECALTRINMERFHYKNYGIQISKYAL